MHTPTPIHRLRRRPAQILLTASILALTSWAAPDLRAQQRPAASGIESLQIRPNIWVLFGAGGNIVVQTGRHGVVVVDTGAQANADQVLAAIKAISPGTIRYIINTSAEPDHIGGNEKLAAAGAGFNTNTQFTGGTTAEVVAREEASQRMSAPSGSQAPFPVSFWPTETYTQQVKSMYVNGEGIQIMYAPAAHSDGDSMVFFRREDVIAVGDLMDLRRFPMIDLAAGGSIQGEIEALNRLLVLAIPAAPLVYEEDRTLIVPGHGRVADHVELVDYRDMLVTIRDLIQSGINKGQTLAQIKAANPAQGFRARYGTDSGPWTTDMFIEAVYKSLTAAKKP